MDVPIGTNYIDLPTRWQSSFKHLLLTSPRVMLQDQHSARGAGLRTFPKQSAAGSVDLLKEIPDLAFSAASVEGLAVAVPISSQSRDRVHICVQRDDFKVCLGKLIVVVVVWQPIFFRVRRPRRVLVPVELLGPVGLPAHAAQRPEHHVWTSCEGIVIPVVVVAQDGKPRNVVQRAARVVDTVGLRPRRLPRLLLHPAPVEVVTHGGHEQQVFPGGALPDDKVLHVLCDGTLACAGSHGGAPISEDQEVVVAPDRIDMDAQRVRGVVLVDVHILRRERRLRRRRCRRRCTAASQHGAAGVRAAVAA
mmetsp:Transcript_44829/g.118677  ORF Transcript_44829/g.118677 Transcript_44829/m.118677 type:complete len:306 (-) Transcript_44829:436-1353(-)